MLFIDAAAIGGRVPEGFRVLRPDEIPHFPVPDQSTLPTQATGDGNLGLEMFRCASAVGMNETANLTNVAYGSVFSFVEPPAELRDDNATYHFLKWDVLEADEARRAILVAEGVPAMGGDAQAEFQDLGPFKSVQGMLSLGADNYTFRGGGQPQGTDALASIRFIEFTEAGDDEFVIWRTNMTSEQVLAGTGSVDLSGAGWVREVVSRDSANAVYLVGRGSFVDSSIVLPYRE